MYIERKVVVACKDDDMPECRIREWIRRPGDGDDGPNGADIVLPIHLQPHPSRDTMRKEDNKGAALIVGDQNTFVDDRSI